MFSLPSFLPGGKALAVLSVIRAQLVLIHQKPASIDTVGAAVVMVPALLEVAGCYAGPWGGSRQVEAGRCGAGSKVQPVQLLAHTPASAW